MASSFSIFGAGFTGLVIARELARKGHKVDVYEAADHLGGLASTFRDDQGFIYDNGPRFIFSTLAEKLGIADQCEPVKYYEHMFVNGRYYLFPFGLIKNPVYALSIGLGMLTRGLRAKPENLAQFLTTYYGQTFSRQVLIPLIQKWSGVSAEKMSLDFASRLLPTNISYILYSLLKRLRGGITEDYYRQGRYIVYPKGSIAALFQAFEETHGLNIHLATPLTRLLTSGNLIGSAQIGSKEIRSDHYVSTIPISSLPDLLDHPEPIQSWRDFRYRGIVILFLKIERTQVLDALWTWFPEAKYRFYRISEFKNALPALAPKDKTLIAVEFSAEEGDRFWSMDADAVYAQVEVDLAELYGLKREEISGMDLKRSPHAYPVLRKETEEAQRALTHHTPYSNLFVAGRTGMFQYRMMEGCYESAMNCVQTIQAVLEGQAPDKIHSLEEPKRDPFGRPLTIPE